MIVSMTSVLVSLKQAHQYGVNIAENNSHVICNSTVRRLRYVVLILTRADMAASQSYVIGNGINAYRALCQFRIFLQHTAPKFYE